MQARLSRGRVHAIIAALENLDHDKRNATKLHLPYTRREREHITGALAWARKIQAKMRTRSQRKQLPLEETK